MTDLISRQAAIDALYDWSNHTMTDAETWHLRQVIGDIKSMPSVQPEIIRCKDCKDYQTDWETSYPNRHYCATMDLVMPEDGFCSFAERREE